MIGVMFERYVTTQKRGNRGDTIQAATSLWSMLQTISLQTTILGCCPHASIAISNIMQKTANMFMEELGIDPICGDDMKLVSFTKNHMNWYKEEVTS